MFPPGQTTVELTADLESFDQPHANMSDLRAAPPSRDQLNGQGLNVSAIRIRVEKIDNKSVEFFAWVELRRCGLGPEKRESQLQLPPRALRRAAWRTPPRHGNTHPYDLPRHRNAGTPAPAPNRNGQAELNFRLVACCGVPPAAVRQAPGQPPASPSAEGFTT
jgi:hypothetical protein